MTYLRYAPQELCLLHQCEFGVNTKLILQKHTSGCQNTKATDATLKDVTPTPVESKTNVLCESTADGKKLENPHSLKSNEMAECQQCEARRRSRILALRTRIESVHWESVSVEMHHQRLDQA